MAPPAQSNRWLPTRKQAFSAFAVAIAILLLNDLFLFESVLVPTPSMVPAILPNERLIVSHLALSPFRRGDVIVFAQGKERLIKRIVGMPGERIRVLGPFEVEVNGRIAPLPPGVTATPVIDINPEVKTFILGPEAYFVMGDNRTDSADSRIFGPVAKSAIQGRAIAVWYSFDRKDHRFRFDRLQSLGR